MKSPIERVARALCSADGHPENIQFEGKPMWQSYLPNALKAIEAMREPSHAMQKAACEQRVSFHSGSGMYDVGKLSMEYPDETDKGAGTVWRTMVDAALQEG